MPDRGVLRAYPCSSKVEVTKFHFLKNLGLHWNAC